jgi:thiamine biosynthesis lipoprotein
MTEPLQETCFVNRNCSSIEGMKRFSHEAMATTFEIIIVHEDERYARQAAIAAFDQVDRLENELSRFRENSDVTRINNLPANQPLQLGLDTFECLKVAKRIYAETSGAFDITIGSLLKCWRNPDGHRDSPREPSPKEIDLARLHTGTNLLELNETEHTVSLSVGGVQIDLGGVGKGYAVDRVAELLRDWSIDVALISGGYSSVLALDAPVARASRPRIAGRACPELVEGMPATREAKMASPQKGWPLTITNPAGSREILARPLLRNAALGGSGVQKGGHIIDPRTVKPVVGRLAAWSWRGRPPEGTPYGAALASHRHPFDYAQDKLAGGKGQGQDVLATRDKDKMSSPQGTRARCPRYKQQGQDALATAATADALSTAFMIMGLDEIEQYCRLHPETLAMVILETKDEKKPQEKILRFGAWETIFDL